MLWALVFVLKAGTPGSSHLLIDKKYEIMIQGVYESYEECDDMAGRALKAFRDDQNLLGAYCMETERDRAK